MFYSIELIDYATPSFISATKQYFGTEENILSVLEVNKQERHIRGGMATKEKYLHKQESE